MEQSVADAAQTAQANAEYVEYIKATFETKDPMRYWEGEFIMPAEGRISSEYGLIRYINGVYGRHAGIDIANPEGTPIYATNSGRVEYAGMLLMTGGSIVIDHGGGIKSYYYHLSEIHVEIGDVVMKSDLIADMGTTGYSTGSHLHFQMMVGDQSFSPWTVINNTNGVFTEPVIVEE